MSRPVAHLAALGVSLTAAMIGALVFYDVTAATAATPTRANIFIGVLVFGTALYFGAVRLILRMPPSAPALSIVVGVAVLMRAAFLPAPPLLSSDIYRYIWDGRVQAAGINPYRYVPADLSLARLRDPDIYPKINRADYARTIYPPAAQMIFAAIGQLTGSVVGMKGAMLLFEAVAILALTRVLQLAGLPQQRILIYAWNPLPLWSFACDGHVDAIAIGFVGLALWSRARHRDGLAGALLALATLTKFLPVVIAPALLRGGRLWRPALIGAAVVGLGYCVYASAGSEVLGFLGSYGREEGYDAGTGFWLLAGLARLVVLPPLAAVAYVTCVGGIFALLAIVVARRKVSGHFDAVVLCRDAAILAGFVTAAFSPHHPWYYAWLALPCVVAPVPAVVWLSAAPVLLYLAPFNEGFVGPPWFSCRPSRSRFGPPGRSTPRFAAAPRRSPEDGPCQQCPCSRILGGISRVSMPIEPAKRKRRPSACTWR